MIIVPSETTSVNLTERTPLQLTVAVCGGDGEALEAGEEVAREGADIAGREGGRLSAPSVDVAHLTNNKK